MSPLLFITSFPCVCWYEGSSTIITERWDPKDGDSLISALLSMVRLPLTQIIPFIVTWALLVMKRFPSIFTGPRVVPFGTVYVVPTPPGGVTTPPISASISHCLICAFEIGMFSGGASTGGSTAVGQVFTPDTVLLLSV